MSAILSGIARGDQIQRGRAIAEYAAILAKGDIATAEEIEQLRELMGKLTKSQADVAADLEKMAQARKHASRVKELPELEANLATARAALNDATNRYHETVKSAARVRDGFAQRYQSLELAVANAMESHAVMQTMSFGNDEIIGAALAVGK